ncbi:MAG: V-type ATP synthase subunit A [Candidatus Aenigmarchaeota archaeon]|nr:V-type ATP synthase subunit A [Candidatus Aenigmarchaeota archaeon]
MKGSIFRVSGPVVIAENLDAKMYDVVRVGDERLVGEVIEINGNRAAIQVYEDTSGLKPGEPVENTGSPLSVELGPGILRSIYDGIQRPLPELQKSMGDFIKRGAVVSALDRTAKWRFTPSVKSGAKVKEGDFIGTVKETETIEHRIMVPIGVSGNVDEIKEGSFTVEDVIAKISGKDVRMMQRWPIRMPRPVREKLVPDTPLITGIRILDSLFPLAKGGTASIPGPFGAGKCVTGDTKILADGKLKPIKDVFDEATGTAHTDGSEKIIELEKPLQIWTFDGIAIKESAATHAYKGKTGSLISVKTRSGREAKLTPVHKLFRLDEKLNIVETEARNLRKGDFIISPRKLEMKCDYQPVSVEFECRIADETAIQSTISSVRKYASANAMTLKEISKRIGVPYYTLRAFCEGTNKPTLSFVRKVEALTGEKIHFSAIKSERDSAHMKIPAALTEELAEFVGYVMSDGMIKGGQSVHFFNQKKELRERYAALLGELFGLEGKEYWAHTVEAVSINSVTLVKFLKALGMPLLKKSRNVNIPDKLLVSPDSVIRSFFRAYISCDGHVGTRELEITSASREMIESMSYLLLRLGILYRTRVKRIDAGTYYRLFIPKREAIKISPYYAQNRYFNSSDIVPMTSALFREILGGRKPFELERAGIPTAGYYAEQNVTVGTMQRMAAELGTLQKFANALDYVFCDKIIAVETIQEEADVYDITVPETHNFVGGNIPMILHNTVTQQSLAKWSDATIIVYVGCGERGNEMTEVLVEFPELTDPRSGKSLMERTMLIANTSNMPVAAREASIYTGITIAEYYRDMGYDVALMADSTSRWAEAMREISSRMEEMPGEEGYPAYLSSRLAEFYERAGKAVVMSGSVGSISVIGAVSPPGGDFSEPVTQATQRITKAFWALDASLASRRHFPSINWTNSYSQYESSLAEWYGSHVSSEWTAVINKVRSILSEEQRLQEIVQLIGSDALPEKEQLTLEVARLVREFFLQQNAFHEVDSYCSPAKSVRMLKSILFFEECARSALDRGVPARDIISVKSKNRISEAKFYPDHEKILDETDGEMKKELEEMVRKNAA